MARTRNARTRRQLTRWRPLWEKGQPALWTRELEGKSGCYLFRPGPGKRVEYVGRSSTGRLRKTMLRHAYPWRGDTAGYEVTQRGTQARVFTTTPADAWELERQLIRRHQPPGNKRSTPTTGDDDIPF